MTMDSPVQDPFETSSDSPGLLRCMAVWWPPLFVFTICLSVHLCVSLGVSVTSVGCKNKSKIEVGSSFPSWRCFGAPTTSE